MRGSVSATQVVVLHLGLCCTYPHLIGLASAPEVAQQILLHHIWPRTAFKSSSISTRDM